MDVPEARNVLWWLRFISRYANPTNPVDIRRLTKGSLSYRSVTGARRHTPTYYGSSYTYFHDAENHLTSLQHGSNSALTKKPVLVTASGLVDRSTERRQPTRRGLGRVGSEGPAYHAIHAVNGRAVAMKQGATLYCLHHDHLGSPVSATNVSGSEIGSARYFPYGKQRPANTTGTNPSGLPSDRLFTGQTRDLGNDAYYFFKSRYYDANIGRFHIPDPVVPGSGNPQALNRYTYALNNPLKLVDPSGHAATANDTGGASPLDISLQAIERMSWKQRQAWLAQFQEIYSTSGWFNNVARVN